VALHPTRKMARIALPALLMLISSGVCQAQYPPGQYPPGQYPPGQYPPGQYPPNTVPVQLPGGVPVGIPVPQVNLPKRGPKGDNSGPDSAKIALIGVDGTLRELGEKDLFIDISGKRMLRFRLLVKTEFRNKQGEPIRDSLLKPGDQLTVQANKTDPETALRVVLVRDGTPAERTAAARPFDHSAARVPVEADMHPAGSIEAVNTSQAQAPAPSTSEPVAGPVEANHPSTEPAADASTLPPPPGVPVDDVIADARAAADSFLSEMPNFLVQQATTRYYSNAVPARWIATDVVTAEVRCVDGKEDYSNILINGRPTNRPIEKTGAWSTGEFVTTLQDLFSPYTAASFVRHGEETIAGRAAYVYDFSVRQSGSHWVIVGPDGRHEAPPYTGRLWVDKERHRVLRLEQRSSVISSALPYDKAESTLEYGFVSIDGKSYLLPVHSENQACMRGRADCTRNEIAFQNYRRFAAESNVTFGKQWTSRN
jgi:hypothetical protein